MPLLPSDSVTFLMTDVEGSTRLWEEDADAMATALRLHDEAAQACVESHGGVLVKSRGEGDSLFCVFADASAAISCAVKFLLGTQSPVQGLALRIRVALHSGEAELRDGDYYGPAVNRCARLRAVANGGQILISEATRRLLPDRLPDPIELVDHGMHRLRDLARPEHVFEAVHPAIFTTSSELRSINRGANSLPIQLTSFVGRTRELYDVCAAVRSNRLVTLIGAGGSGKTRLAIQAAGEVSGEFPDGVWFVDLTRAGPDETVTTCISRALQLGRTGSATLNKIADEIHGRQLVIVLDNCEHVVDEAAEAAHSILSTCSTATILATSREELRVAGEHVISIHPLRVPGPGSDLESIAASDAVSLFLDRARAHSRSIVLDDDNAGDVAELVRSLEGIPLAIEHAASHAAVFGPAQMLDRFRPRLLSIRSATRGIPERHRTLGAAIDWSYESLTKPERVLFHRCTVFPSTWDVESAEVVCSSDDLSRSEILELLESLVSKSMILVVERPSTGVIGPRREFRMLQTLLEYGREAGGSQPEALERHAKLILSRGIREGADFNVEAMWEDLVQAAAWLEENAPRRCLDLLMAVRHPIFGAERFGFLSRSLSAALNRYSPDPESRARVLNVIGACRWQLGDFAGALTALKQSDALWSQLGRDDQRVTVLNNMGSLAAEMGLLDEAFKTLEQCHHLAVQYGNEPHAAISLLNLACAKMDAGEHEESIQLSNRAIDGLLAVGDQDRAVFAYCNLSQAYLHSGQPSKSASAVRGALGIQKANPRASHLVSAGLLIAELWRRQESIEFAERNYQLTANLIAFAEPRLSRQDRELRDVLISRFGDRRPTVRSFSKEELCRIAEVGINECDLIAQSC